MLKCNRFIIIICLLLLNFHIFTKSPVRIKDIALIEGIRNNQLMGFGLVTGLQGRGDSKSFKLTQKMLLNLAINHGFNIDISEINSKNIASVLVTANLEPFSREGDFIDITISSIGDAKSLSGGVLLLTPLKGADDNVYAVAQGKILAGTQEQNSENTASIPDGAIIEREITSDFIRNNRINLILKYPDFVTVNQIKEQILTLNPDLEIIINDPGLIEIVLTEEEQKNPIDFIAALEILTVTPDYVSTVVIDKKTGIIVMGEDIIIQECSISTAFAQININSNKSKSNLQIKGQTIGDLVESLNKAGLNNDEIISLIESIYKIGAINAKIIIL